MSHRSSKIPAFALCLESAALLVGSLLAYLFFGGPEASVTSFIQFLYWYIGITVVSLLPLTVWAVDLVLMKSYDDITLSYISAQAKEQGFIGTLIGIMLMLFALDKSLREGDFEGIRQVMGGFAQAIITTLIGCSIAAFCKHYEYLGASSAKTSEATDP